MRAKIKETKEKQIMSERLKSQKSEIKYGAKNSFGETYSEIERDLRATALENTTLPEGKGKSIAELTQEQRNTTNSQERLDEFRVKDPELARAMAEAEDDERTKAAALRFLNEGIRTFSNEKIRTSEPGIFSQDKVVVRSMDPTFVKDHPQFDILDHADAASGRTDISSDYIRSPGSVDSAYREAISQAADSKEPPITLSELRNEIGPLVKKHESNAEELGERAAKQYLKNYRKESERAA